VTGSRLSLLIFGVVFAAALVLAALGYLSLRRWEQAAERQLREQARDAATMAAEKVEMAVVRVEQDAVADIQAAVMDHGFGADAVAAWRARHPLFDAVYLCARDGRVPAPAAATAASVRARSAGGTGSAGAPLEGGGARCPPVVKESSQGTGRMVQRVACSG